jgi:hypothetical protein
VHTTNELPVLFAGSKETVSAVQHDNIPLGSAEDLHVTPRRDGLISESRVMDTVTPLGNARYLHLAYPPSVTAGDDNSFFGVNWTFHPRGLFQDAAGTGYLCVVLFVSF